MRKGGRFALLVCLLMAALAGCGRTKDKETVDSTTIIVDKNGGLTYYLVGEFDKEYYNLSELSDMAKSEAAKFSGGAGDKQPVTVDGVEKLPKDESKVLISYRFDGYKSFNEFTQGRFFYGTVDEAFRQGYLRKVILKNVRDGTYETEEQLRQEGTEKIIITDEKALIYCPAKVACLSTGAVLEEDGSVDTSAAEQTVYILMR